MTNMAKSVIRPGLIFNLIKHFAVHWQMVVTWQDKDRVENEIRSELAGVTKQEALRGGTPRRKMVRTKQGEKATQPNPEVKSPKLEPYTV